jgi:hypothetical protein
MSYIHFLKKTVDITLLCISKGKMPKAKCQRQNAKGKMPNVKGKIISPKIEFSKKIDFSKTSLI